MPIRRRIRWWSSPSKTKRPPQNTSHYYAHREAARVHITERVTYWNQYYNFTYKRIAIRNQRSRWGSCSALGNLNFNYKLLFLPSHLCDYIVVHELCHLKELNHGPRFWAEIGRTLPDYRHHVRELRHLERNFGTSVQGITKVQAHYQSRTKGLE